MEGHHSYNHPRQQNQGRSPPGSESEKDDNMSKKYGHVVQSRAIQKSHALPRSSSRSKSRGKSRGDSAAGSRISRSNSRGRMQTPQNNHINNSQNSFALESKKESLKRCSSLGMIRDGKIDEHGRCRNHPNIELCKRDSTNSNAPWRILLQDCPLCSLNNGNNSNHEMLLRRESNNILSGELTAQTGETATTSPSSGDETSDDSDRSNNNDGVIIRPSSATSRHAPPPQRKQSSVQTLKALGKMHTMEGDGDTASISARSMASRRSRHPPPPPPAGRSPHTNSSNKSSPSKKGNNAGLNTSMSSLSTKELSRMRKQRYSSEGINERIADRRKQQHAENDEIAQNQSLERLRAERLAARDRLIGQRTTSSTRSNSLREQSEREESSGTFTIPMNDVGRGRAAVLDDDILGAAAEIRARARRSLSRSRERRKASDDIFGTTSTLGEESTADGDTVSVASKGRRSIMNPHGLAEPPKPLPVQRRSQSRERRSRRNGRGEIDGEGSDRHRFDANYERSSEVLINRRREMRQRLAERQNAADHRRVSSGADVGGDRDYQSVRDEAMDDWTMDTRRSGRSKERNERGRGRSRSRVRDGLSKIRSVSLNAFRKKDNKRAESEDRSVDSGRMSFRSLVSKGSRLRSRSRGRVKSVDGWDTTSAFDMQRSVSEDFDSLSMSKSDIGTSREGRRGSGTIVGRLSNSQHSRLEDDFDNLRGLGNDNNALHVRSVRSGAFEV